MIDRKIDCYVIGAHKGGTTSFCDYLAQHPDIFFPEIKETRFFHVEALYTQGQSFLDPFYKGVKDEAIIGGADVHSMYFFESAQRMYRYNPEMKVIAILRNPVDRAYSAYWWGCRNGQEKCETFEEALEKEPERIHGTYTEQAELTYLSHGHYFEQLEPYLEVFGRENVKIFLTEDLSSTCIEDTLASVLAWLGIKDDVSLIDTTRRSNEAGMPKTLWLQKILMSHDTWYRRMARSIISPSLRHTLQQSVVENLKSRNVKAIKYPQMKPETRARLSAYFEPHNRELSKLIGRDLSHWV